VKQQVKQQTSKKKFTKSVPAAFAYVTATFNNTLVTLTDPSGNTLSWASAGSAGFKGTRKSTAFAAQRSAHKVYDAIQGYGITKLDVFVKGPGPGRDAVMRALNATGVNISSITDITPMAHNGVRPSKKRRI